MIQRLTSEGIIQHKEWPFSIRENETHICFLGDDEYRQKWFYTMGFYFVYDYPLNKQKLFKFMYNLLKEAIFYYTRTMKESIYWKTLKYRESEMARVHNDLEFKRKKRL